MNPFSKRETKQSLSFWEDTQFFGERQKSLCPFERSHWRRLWATKLNIGYETVAYWHDEEITPIRGWFFFLDEAESAGKSWGCMAGVRLVEVRSANGALQAFWNKALTGEEGGVRNSGLWKSVSNESRELARLSSIIIFEAMRERATSAEAAERLQLATPLIRDALSVGHIC